MKKLWILAIAAIISACVSAPSSSTPGLDDAIRQASMEINDRLPTGTIVALLNFTSNSNDFSEYVIEEMTMYLVNAGKLTVVDRRTMDQIRGEMDFQMSGEVDDASAQELGMMLGAQSIVSGSMVFMGQDYRFRTKVISVQTAAIQSSTSANVGDTQQIRYLLGQGGSTPAATARTGTAQSAPRVENLTLTLANETGDVIHSFAFVPTGSNADEIQQYDFPNNLANRNSSRFTIPSIDLSKSYLVMLVDVNESNLYLKRNVTFSQNMTLTFTASDLQPQTAQAQTPAPSPTTPAPAPAPTPAQSTAPSTYRIGDTGPAGGLIFYDKGNNSNGWRYLEAAPMEAEFQAVWSVRGTVVEGTREEIGQGRRNTQLIVEKYAQTSGEWDTAAQYADDLVFNGFDDWFLPSKDELDQMYGNLRRRNLGDFKNESYWSSSAYNNGYYIYRQGFQTGPISYEYYTSRYFVRPIRQVPGPN